MTRADEGILLTGKRPRRSIELVQLHEHRPWGVRRLVGHEVQERKRIFWLQRYSNLPVQAHEELFIGPCRALRAAQAVKVREEAIQQPQRQGSLRAWTFNLQRQERYILIQPTRAINSGKLAWHVSNHNTGTRHSWKSSALLARQVSASQC